MPRAVMRLAVISFFILFAAASAGAGTSVNVPAGSRVYEDIELLEVKGLVPGAMLSSKPFSRMEASRLVTEARDNLRGLSPEQKERLAGAAGVLVRLEREFGDELSGAPADAYLRPERLYARFLYSDEDPYFSNVNNDGDLFKSGANLRTGAALRGAAFDTVSVYLNPELRGDGEDFRGRLLYGYLALDAAGARILAGRDAMWWGAGAHGGLLMTDNARPFDMIKASADHPFRLPWLFGYLGQFMPTVFLTHLEGNRDFPHANLLGMRLDFKPTERFQIAVNRVFMFGGDGRKSLTASDWARVFFASDSAEHADSPINGNQIASIDASYVYVNTLSALPFSGIKVYTEWGAEDSSGRTKTPTGRANLYGALIDGPFWLDNTDLRIEWANTARSARYGPSWYRHGVYTSGYTYEGRVIGHHMGGDSRDLFLRYRYRASGAVLGLEADFERSGVHSDSVKRRNWIGLDGKTELGPGLSVSGGFGYGKKTGDAPGDSMNAVAWTEANWIF